MFAPLPLERLLPLPEVADDRTLQEVISKANKKLGLLKRNLKGCPQPVKKIAYIRLIRSGLEYAAVIWDLHSEVHLSNKVDLSSAPTGDL